MSLLTIAELLAGEALVTPGGPVDRVTALGDDDALWAHGAPRAIAPSEAPSRADEAQERRMALTSV